MLRALTSKTPWIAAQPSIWVTRMCSMPFSPLPM
jgi:hypothetical protein